ncbi:MAG: hypothetical protein KJZ93_00520, partial [Caldilineaceae bacterium]|nr:hypothetical protein [Caldilineaceae bacterium]
NHHIRIFAPIVALLALLGCTPIMSHPTAAPAVEPAEARIIGDLPPAVEYNLGDTTIVQARFPADSRFRNMPVRLNGMLAAPLVEGGPFPVVVIFHGNHPGCPIPPGDEVDRWPCDPETEQPNYRGFAYLVRHLAGHGYVALSINMNAENTFGFGEPQPGERLQQLVDLHLNALAKAAAGGDNPFEVELAGRVDLRRLALFGHSRGAEAAFALANQRDSNLNGAPPNIYGPVAGLLMIAPAVVSVDPTGGSHAPMALILPACDADVLFQEGQHFYEAARIAPSQSAWATSVWLEQANHNHFNELLADEQMGRPDRPDCVSLLDANTQHNFLKSFAVDFLTAIFSDDPAVIRTAMIRLGMDSDAPAQDTLYELPTRIATLASARHRLTLLTPATADELTTSRVGASVIAEGITTHFCPEGYYTPAMLPGSEPCRRVNVAIPGQPALVVVSWSESGGALRFLLPVGANNLHLFGGVSVRAAVDPLSPYNTAGVPQRFSIQLTDGAGNRANAPTRPDEPALQFPAGVVEKSEFFEGGLFTGRVPLTTIRLPLSAFEGVDLATIVEIALVFDQAPSGSLFLGDVEVVRSPISQQETLDAPPSTEKIAAAEAGDVEAQRQIANVYRPRESLGVHYGNVEKAVFWYRKACAAGYANAQVDFYEFAAAHAETASDRYLEEAIVCLEDALRQGHRQAILNGAFRAVFIDGDHKTGFFRYALFEETEPDLAEQRWTFADQLTQAEIDEAEEAAAAWRASNRIKSYDDFFREVNSPFRQPSTPPPAP